MLKQRIITALVLLAILVPVVLYPDSRLFTLVALAFISAGAWEMGRLTGWGGAASVVVGLASFFAGIALWAAGVLDLHLRSLWLACACFWVLFSAWILHQGATAWLAVPSWVRLCGGIFALLAAWLAVSQGHAIGINYMFSVLFLVWAADVGAYFAGRSMGGRFIQRKLAPSVSPGKTWEGAIGGLATVFLIAAGWQYLEAQNSWGTQSIYARLAGHGSVFYVVAVLFLVTMSVVGDLVESLLKRSVGVKDSSALLPGHGGILDRIDALLPVLPIAMMLGTL
jgi:phosphatidate cytidylyltransferase